MGKKGKKRPSLEKDGELDGAPVESSSPPLSTQSRTPLEFPTMGSGRVSTWGSMPSGRASGGPEGTSVLHDNTYDTTTLRDTLPTHRGRGTNRGNYNRNDTQNTQYNTNTQRSDNRSNNRVDNEYRSDTISNRGRGRGDTRTNIRSRDTQPPRESIASTQQRSSDDILTDDKFVSQMDNVRLSQGGDRGGNRGGSRGGRGGNRGGNREGNQGYQRDYRDNQQGYQDDYQGGNQGGRGKFSTYRGDDRGRGGKFGQSQGQSYGKYDSSTYQAPRGNNYKQGDSFRPQAVSRFQQSYKPGDPVNVVTNYFKIDFDTKKTIYMYSIICEPKNVPKGNIKQFIADLMMDVKSKFQLNTREKIICDKCSIIYTSKKINGLENYKRCVEAKNNEGAMVTYIFTISFSKELNLQTMLKDEETRQSIIAAFETILKNSCDSLVALPRLVISSTRPIYYKYQNWFEVWRGVRQHIILNQSKTFYVNLDVGFAAVHPHKDLTSIMSSMKENYSFLNLLDTDRESALFITEFIKGLIVKLKHINIKKRVVKVSKKTAGSYKFSCEVNGITKVRSVVEYFSEKYKTPIKYPKYPLIKLQPKTKKIYVPAELCIVEKWQVVANKNDIISKIGEKSIMHAVDRSNQTNELLNETYVHRQSEAFETLQSFGITINTGMVTVDNSILPAPAIQFGRNSIVTPDNGSFSNKNNSKFYLPAKLDNICLASKSYYTENFESSFYDIARKRGIEVNNFKRINNFTIDKTSDIEKLAQQVPSGCQLIVILIDNKKLENFMYQDIKTIFDIKMGIPSQIVVITEKDKKNMNNKMQNLMLKINAKAGGKNFYCLDAGLDVGIFNRSKSSIMVMGADVNHSANSSSSNCALSSAAVVASLDNEFCTFTTEFALNERGKDIILDMTEITIKCLKKFYEKNKKYPAHVVMFRDGLSEGLLLFSKAEEIKAMKEAFNQLKIKPKFTFICVQKRHNTRFYNECVDDKNTPPGTYIKDAKICSQDMFYLQPHKNIKGTAKAAQYKVLYDDNNSTREQIAAFAFLLSYNYCRSFGAVSIPSPQYYSHLSALRSSLYKNNFEKIKENHDERKKIDRFPKDSAEAKALLKPYTNRLKASITPHSKLQGLLYYV